MIVLWIFLGGVLIVAGVALTFAYMADLVRRFAWTLPYDTFLVVTNTREYQDTTLCYYVKGGVKAYDDGVQFEGCLVDMNNPNIDGKARVFTQLRIPRAWILSKKTKIRCFDTETLKNYIEMLKNNTNTNEQFS
jgi:hypothetical protein